MGRLICIYPPPLSYGRPKLDADRIGGVRYQLSGRGMVEVGNLTCEEKRAMTTFPMNLLVGDWSEPIERWVKWKYREHVD